MKVIYVARWCMTIVYLFGLLRAVSYCWNTISTKYYCIILFYKLGWKKKVPFEFDMTKSFCEYLWRYWNYLSRKSFLSQIKTPWAKETWCYIWLQSFPHHKYKTFSSSFIKKGIMKDENFWWFHYPLITNILSITV